MTSAQQHAIEREGELLVEEIDEALHRLAAAGLAPLDGLKFLLQKVGMSLPLAKRRVQFSGAWRLLDKEVEVLHDELEAAMDADFGVQGESAAT